MPRNKNKNNQPAPRGASLAPQAAPVNPDGVLDSLGKKLKKNKNIVIGAVAAVIIAAAAWAAWEQLQEKKYQAQWQALFAAELEIMKSAERSLTPLENFAAQQPSTEAGVYAAFTLGNIYYQSKDYPKAEVYFKQVMAHGNKYMAPMAETSLIAAQVAAQNYPAAIAQADAFAAAYPAHFAMAQVKHYKVLAQELAGQTAAAKEGYAGIVLDYPNTYYSAFAQQRLGDMK